MLLALCMQALAAVPTMVKRKDTAQQTEQHQPSQHGGDTHVAATPSHTPNGTHPGGRPVYRSPLWYKCIRLLAFGTLLLSIIDTRLPFETYILGGPGYGGRLPLRPGNVSDTQPVPDSIEAPPWGQTGDAPKLSGAHSWSKTPAIHDQQGIERMRTVGLLASRALALARNMVAPGVTTDEIDKAVHRFLIGELAYPSPLHFNGYPKSICTSVNEVMVHGIPDDRPLQEGDIVNVDVSTYFDGMHSDTSATFQVGQQATPAARLVVSASREALDAAVAACGPGKTLGDLGRAVQAVADATKTSTVRAFIGHGIGHFFHGAPRVYAFAPKGWWDVLGWSRLAMSGDYWQELQPGQTITIEPIIVEPKGSTRIQQWKDKWTTVTVDGALSAQFEYTVLVQEPGTGPGKGGCEALTPFLWEQDDRQQAVATGAT